MTAAALLAEVRATGADLSVRDGELVLHRRARLPDALRARLVAAKAEIRAALLAENSRPERDACGGCGRTDWVVSVVADDGSRACSRCVRGAGGAR